MLTDPSFYTAGREATTCGATSGRDPPVTADAPRSASETPDLGAEARTDLWVNFKVFGLMGLTLVFAVVQMLLISRHLVDNNDAKS